MGESSPGKVAAPDFGHLGHVEDQETGLRRAVWAPLVVLAYSGTATCGPPAAKSWRT